MSRVTTKPHWINCHDCGFSGLDMIPHVCEPNEVRFAFMRAAQAIADRYEKTDRDILEIGKIIEREWQRMEKITKQEETK